VWGSGSGGGLAASAAAGGAAAALESMTVKSADAGATFNKSNVADSGEFPVHTGELPDASESPRISPKKSVGGSGRLDALEKAKVPKKFDSTFACVNLQPEVFTKTVNGKVTKDVRPGGVTQAAAAAIFVKYGYNHHGYMPYEVFIKALLTSPSRQGAIVNKHSTDVESPPPPPPPPPPPFPPGGVTQNTHSPDVESPPPPPCVYMSIRLDGKSSSNLGRVLVLNDPLARLLGMEGVLDAKEADHHGYEEHDDFGFDGKVLYPKCKVGWCRLKPTYVESACFNPIFGMTLGSTARSSTQSARWGGAGWNPCCNRLVSFLFVFCYCFTYIEPRSASRGEH